MEPKGEGEDDPELLVGSDSPALEEYRRWKAKHAKIDYAERLGVLVHKPKVREGLLEIASRLRSFGETLQRHYGNAATDLLDDALTDCEDAIGRLYADDDNDEDPNSDGGE